MRLPTYDEAAAIWLKQYAKRLDGCVTISRKSVSLWGTRTFRRSWKSNLGFVLFIELVKMADNIGLIL